jgi:hypothetical protein
MDEASRLLIMIDLLSARQLDTGIGRAEYRAQPQDHTVAIVAVPQSQSQQVQYAALL